MTRYRAAPDQVLASGDPIAAALYAKYYQIPMPNLGLSSGDVAAVLAYLEAQGQASAGSAHQQLILTPQTGPPAAASDRPDE